MENVLHKNKVGNGNLLGQVRAAGASADRSTSSRSKASHSNPHLTDTAYFFSN